MVVAVQDDLIPKKTHHGIACNKCKTSKIIGNPYFSPEDINYNLCDICEQTSIKTNKSSALS